MKIVEEKNILNLEKFVLERIKGNKKLFDETEIEFAEKNKKLIKKIYLMGLIDSKNCYEQSESLN